MERFRIEGVNLDHNAIPMYLGTTGLPDFSPSNTWRENFVELLGYDNLKLMIPSVKQDMPLVGISFIKKAERR